MRPPERGTPVAQQPPTAPLGVACGNSSAQHDAPDRRVGASPGPYGLDNASLLSACRWGRLRHGFYPGRADEAQPTTGSPLRPARN